MKSQESDVKCLSILFYEDFFLQVVHWMIQQIKARLIYLSILFYEDFFLQGC
mgnify:CR=1 FL=1